MGDNTHTLAVGANNNSDTGSVHVPADVQREQGICIGTEVEVTIENIEGLFSSIAFENEQISGDRVSIPAEVMRATGLEPGERYPMSFDVVEDDEPESEAEQEAESLEYSEYAISDDEVEDGESDSLDELLDDLESEVEDEEDEEVEAEDDDEEQGLGELFG